MLAQNLAHNVHAFPPIRCWRPQKHTPRSVLCASVEMLRANTICLTRLYVRFDNEFSLPFKNPPQCVCVRVSGTAAAFSMQTRITKKEKKKKPLQITPYRFFRQPRSVTAYKSYSRIGILSSGCGAATFNSD